MDRSDFIERGELKVDFLKYYRLVSRWAAKNNNLNIADLELLFYLDPILYFTINDFKDGTLFYSWDKERFYRLQREGWIDKTHKGVGRRGDHNKYKVSQKGKLLINKIYRILIDKEDIPSSARRNTIMKRKTYIDKVYSQAIKKFNKQKI
jgi:DNA-binding PadR family transcriptional regulator|tara:strand:- start:1118 stop:1567 length:450 start_codon:yes stop_codon:yes gene_type:complete